MRGNARRVILRFYRNISAFIVALVMMLFMSVGTAQAATSAATKANTSTAPTVNDIEESMLAAFLEDAGVPAGQRKRLLEKWRAGEPWDSQIADSQVVSQRVLKHEFYTETVDIFADGSVAISKVDKPRKAGKTAGEYHHWASLSVQNRGPITPSTTTTVMRACQTASLPSASISIMSIHAATVPTSLGRATQALLGWALYWATTDPQSRSLM